MQQQEYAFSIGVKILSVAMIERSGSIASGMSGDGGGVGGDWKKVSSSSLSPCISSWCATDGSTANVAKKYRQHM